MITFVFIFFPENQSEEKSESGSAGEYRHFLWST